MLESKVCFHSLEVVQRLKGGGLVRKQAEHVLRQKSSTEIDDRELVSDVKARVARDAISQRLVLNSQRNVNILGNEDKSGTFLKFHPHGNRVVIQRVNPKKIAEKREREEALRLKKLEDLRQNIATSRISKHRSDAIKKCTINCSLALDHELFNISEFVVFLRQRIKVEGGTGKLDGILSVDLSEDNRSVFVSSHRATQMKARIWSKRRIQADAFSTRYLKYLTKKWICQVDLRDFVRLISIDHSRASRARGANGTRFELRYTNVNRNPATKLKMARRHGTRLEQARLQYAQSLFADADASKPVLRHPSQILPRRIKATGERVGGPAALAAAKTVGQKKRDDAHRLRHWLALQQRTYREPLGGAMRGFKDRSILRHDPDRVGTGNHARSTAGYTGPRVPRARSGLRVGVESALYTGIAADGFRSAARRITAQRLMDRDQTTRRHVLLRAYSVGGEADRRIYNWRPKWFYSGKMDTHKRDWR